MAYAEQVPGVAIWRSFSHPDYRLVSRHFESMLEIDPLLLTVLGSSLVMAAWTVYRAPPPMNDQAYFQCVKKLGR